MKFYGRKKELGLLDQLWASPKSEFLIVYGRRRVGKTALLAEWIRRTGNRTLYWVASPTSAVAQLRSFSQAVYNFGNQGSPAPDDFSYASWQQALQQVAQLARDDRAAIFIDEFTYLLEVEPGIAGLLQNTWGQVDRALLIHYTREHRRKGHIHQHVHNSKVKQQTRPPVHDNANQNPQ